MKALITGVNGFVGGYLKKELENHSIEVVGTSNSEGIGVDYEIDILHADEVEDMISEVKPDYILHLAAQSSVKLSWENPNITHQINVIGTRNLLNACVKAKISPRFLLISSSEVYGIPKKVPIPETHELNPLSPYAESKVEQGRNMPKIYG